jgi:aspartate/methionine/tyrosine aminotransferase
MPAVASSVRTIPQSGIRQLAEIAMSMDGVLRLYFGESNLPTPDYIKQAAIRAMEEGYTFYTENAGLPSLRGAIAAHYRRLQAVELDPRPRDRGHGLRSPSAQSGDTLRARSGRRSGSAHACLA